MKTSAPQKTDILSGRVYRRFFRTKAIGVRGEIDLWGTGMVSRQDWVEVLGTAAARERRRRESHARGPSARKFWKIDYRKRVFQAFQALSRHYEGVGNSKETAGENWILIQRWTKPNGDYQSMNNREVQ